MAITFNFPPVAEQAFRKAWGKDLDRKGLESMAIECYRERKLSLGKLAQIMGFATTHNAEEWLAGRGVPLNYSPDDLRRDFATLEHLPRLIPPTDPTDE